MLSEGLFLRASLLCNRFEPARVDQRTSSISISSKSARDLTSHSVQFASGVKLRLYAVGASTKNARFDRNCDIPQTEASVFREQVTRWTCCVGVDGTNLSPVLKYKGQ